MTRENNGEQDIIEAESTALPTVIEAPLSTDTLLQIAAKVEDRVAAVKKIKAMAFGVTNNNDWVDIGGKPYLEVSGAEKIRMLFGVSWAIDPPEIFNYEDGHFTYVYVGQFSFSGSTIEAIGSRSSKDFFFSTRYKWNDVAGKKLPIQLPPKEIDRASVQKSAYTNCIGNGITRMLGLRNMTWEELKDAGINQQKTSKVNYGNNKKQPDGIGKLKNGAFKSILKLPEDQRAAFQKKVTAATTETEVEAINVEIAEALL